MKNPKVTAPETRVGNCCACQRFPMPLFKVPGLYRYRCAECFERETGYRHHLAPDRLVVEAAAAGIRIQAGALP